MRSTSANNVPRASEPAWPPRPEEQPKGCVGSRRKTEQHGELWCDAHDRAMRRCRQLNATVRVHFTAAIVREYDARAVYEGYAEQPGDDEVPVHVARDMLHDAEHRADAEGDPENEYGNRATGRAYAALAKRLRESLRVAEGGGDK